MPLSVIHVAELVSGVITSNCSRSPSIEAHSLRLGQSLGLELAIFEVQRSVITPALFGDFSFGLSLSTLLLF